MSYPVTCRFAAITCIALAFGFFFVPATMLGTFGVETTPSADFTARRMAVFLLGLAVLAFAGATLQSAEGRKVIAVTFTITMVAMAVLGAAEVIRGYAGPGIWLAVAVEALFALLFARLSVMARD